MQPPHARTFEGSLLAEITQGAGAPMGNSGLKHLMRANEVARNPVIAGETDAGLNGWHPLVSSVLVVSWHRGLMAVVSLGLLGCSAQAPRSGVGPPEQPRVDLELSVRGRGHVQVGGERCFEHRPCTLQVDELERAVAVPGSGWEFRAWYGVDCKAEECLLEPTRAAKVTVEFAPSDPVRWRRNIADYRLDDLALTEDRVWLIGTTPDRATVVAIAVSQDDGEVEVPIRLTEGLPVDRLRIAATADLIVGAGALVRPEDLSRAQEGTGGGPVPSGHVFAYDLTGRERWRLALGEGMLIFDVVTSPGGPCVAGEGGAASSIKGLQGNSGGFLLCISRDGRVRWVRSLVGSRTLAVAVVDDTVRAVRSMPKGFEIVAFDIRTGQQAGSWPITGGHAADVRPSAALLSNGFLLLSGTQAGGTRCDGTPLEQEAAFVRRIDYVDEQPTCAWELPLPGGRGARSLYANDADVAVGVDDGQRAAVLWVLRLDGHRRWTHRLRGRISEVQLGADEATVLGIFDLDDVLAKLLTFENR